MTSSFLYELEKMWKEEKPSKKQKEMKVQSNLDWEKRKQNDLDEMIGEYAKIMTRNRLKKQRGNI